MISASAQTEMEAHTSVAPDHDSAGQPLPVYFGRGRRLFGWYHQPAGPTVRECAVVICSPLGYEELCAHRALRHWANALANAGIATLRFDYDGTGNSAGNDTDANRVADWIASIDDATVELRAQSGAQTIVLAGVRVGATLATAAAQRTGADALVLFAPYATGRAYAREVLALSRMMRAGDNRDAAADSLSDSVAQIAGFVMTPETVADLSALDPLAHVSGVRRAYVVPRDDISADAAVADRLTTRGVEVERANLPGYKAMMVDAHESIAPQAVIDDSVRWLTSHYPAASIERKTGRAPHHHDRVEGPTERGVRESAVVFDAERRLFGVLSEATAPNARCETGIILANSGSVHSVGPGRLYVELARGWAALGFSVLRMDVGGVGDSETRDGCADNHPYPEHAVQDLAAAARWMIERAGVRRVVLAGLCSGAHASFHGGLEVHGIAGIMVVNPIVFYWNSSCALDVAAWMNYYESRRYSRSVREVGAWVRLARGEVNVRYAVRVGVRRMLDVVRSTAAALWSRLGLAQPDGEDVGADLERISARGVDVLLVFSEGDPGLDFVQRRHARDVRVLERRRSNFAMRIIPGADHTFTRLEARARLSALLTDHLMARHR